MVEAKLMRDSHKSELTGGGETSLHSHAGGGGSQPYVHLGKNVTQNVGGSNGSVTYVSWQVTDHKDSEFTHDSGSNPSRIQVNQDGRYSIKANVSAEQGGSARTTLAICGRKNGSTLIERAKHRNYSRGSGYGDLSLIWLTELELNSGDYIEIAVIVDDTDQTYTINTFNDECEVIMRKIG